MKHPRIRLRGASQRSAITQQLRSQLSAWLRDWSVDPDWLTLSAGKSAPFDADLHWIVETGKNGSVWLGARNSCFRNVGPCLARASSADPMGIAERLGRRALRSLLSLFAGTQVLGSHSLGETGAGTIEAPHKLTSSRFGGLTFEVSGIGFSGVVVLNDEQCDFWAGPVAHAPPTMLESRQAAIGVNRLSLNAVIDFGPTRLADTEGLRVGDVLVSSASLNQGLELVHHDGRFVAMSHLFRDGPLRALQLVPTSNPKGLSDK